MAPQKGPKKALKWSLFGEPNQILDPLRPLRAQRLQKGPKRAILAQNRLRRSILAQKGPKKGPFWPKIDRRRRSKPKMAPKRAILAQNRLRRSILAIKRPQKAPKSIAVGDQGPKGPQKGPKKGPFGPFLDPLRPIWPQNPQIRGLGPKAPRPKAENPCGPLKMPIWGRRVERCTLF